MFRLLWGTTQSSIQGICLPVCCRLPMLLAVFATELRFAPWCGSSPIKYGSLSSVTLRVDTGALTVWAAALRCSYCSCVSPGRCGLCSCSNARSIKSCPLARGELGIYVVFNELCGCCQFMANDRNVGTYNFSYSLLVFGISKLIKSKYSSTSSCAVRVNS